MIVEYGFAIPDNRYDFVRRRNLTINTFYGEFMQMSGEVRERFEQKLSQLGMKSTL